MTDDQSAGATPVVPGVTPGQTDDQAATATAEPVTDDAANLKKALDAERAQRRELEKSLKAERVAREALETSQLSEHEKAIAQVRRDVQVEAEQSWGAKLRRSEVRRELAIAGLAPDLLDEIARSDAFAALEIDEAGQIGDLAKAVAAYRSAHPSAFLPARAAAGNFDGGTGGGSAALTFSRASIGAMSQAEYERHERDILAAAREGRIRD